MNNRIDPFDELAAMFLTAPQPAAPMDSASPAHGSISHASAQPMTPSPSNSHAILTELLMVGHLPVRAGLWLVPYADLLAREMGAVGLIRLDAQEPSLQLLRAPEAFANAPLRMPLQKTILDLAACVDVWILRGSEHLSADDALDSRPDRITILSSADEAAVVAAYQSIKELVQAAEHPHRTLPAIGMAIVGSDAHAAEAAIDRLNRTTISFLGVEVRLVALLPRMDAGIKCTRYITFGNESTPDVLEVRHWIEQAKTMPRQMPAAGHHDFEHAPAQFKEPPMPTPSQQSAPPHHPLHAEPAVIGRISPPPETFVHDARRILRSPSEEFTEVPPPPQAQPSPQHRPNVAPFAPRHAASTAHAPVSPSSPSESSLHHGVITPDERDDLIGSIAGSKPSSTTGAKLPPKVVMTFEHKPAPSHQPVIEPSEHGLPVSLAKFVEGLVSLPLRPPGHERIELAVDACGCIHLLARESELRELPVVERWAHAHRELLAMACPQHAFNPAGHAVSHVFSAEPARLADLHGSSLRLHVLAPVTVGETTAWFAAPLNIVR